MTCRLATASRSAVPIRSVTGVAEPVHATAHT